MPCVVLCMTRTQNGYVKGDCVEAYNTRISLTGVRMYQIGEDKATGLPNWVDNYGDGKNSPEPKRTHSGLQLQERSCAEQKFAVYVIGDRSAEQLETNGDIGPMRSQIHEIDHLTKAERDDVANPRKRTKPFSKPTLNGAAIIPHKEEDRKPLPREL